MRKWKNSYMSSVAYAAKVQRFIFTKISHLIIWQGFYSISESSAYTEDQRILELLTSHPVILTEGKEPGDSYLGSGPWIWKVKVVQVESTPFSLVKGNPLTIINFKDRMWVPSMGPQNGILSTILKNSTETRRKHQDQWESFFFHWSSRQKKKTI